MTHITEMTGERVSQQLNAVADLQSQHPHSVELETPAIPGDPASFRYTCFQYAFALVDPPPLIVQIATVWPEVYPNAKFVQYLIENYLQVVTPGEVCDGDIVVYFEAGEPRHAGVVRGQQVVSKWGTAHLWRHGLYEVPAGYGSEVRFFRPLDSDQSQEAFLKFAERETGESFLEG